MNGITIGGANMMLTVQCAPGASIGGQLLLVATNGL
jgi:hypothetical protein